MSVRLPTLALGAWSAGSSDLLARLGQFWLQEFLALFPVRIAQWLVGRGRSSLVLVADDQTVELRLLGDGRQPLASERVARADYAPALIERFLQSQKIGRKDMAVGVRLPAEKIFHRTLTLPIEAMRSLDRIVEQDLTGKTPFRRQDIHYGYAATRAAGADKIVVRQWVARRDFVEHAIADLGLALDDVAFVDAEGEIGDASAPFIALRPDQADRSAWIRRSAMALAGSALLLVLVAGGHRYWRQAAILDDLDLQMTSVRAKAQQVRAAIDKLEQKQKVLLRLRSQKADVPGLLEAWEEATRILPSHSWLTELRLAETPGKHEQQVSMTGFSTAASSLVGIIDGSPYFTDASLTAPIALDAREQRERFALQAKLRRPEPMRRASR
jgi:general secretion pathway protein L